MKITRMESPVGELLLGASEHGLCLLEFVHDRETDSLKFRRGASDVSPGTNAHLEEARQQLEEYFAGQRTEFTVPLDYAGTPFQSQVWKKLRSISYGTTAHGPTAKAGPGREGSRGVARRRSGQRAEPDRHHQCLPSRREQERQAGRLRRRALAQTISFGSGAGTVPCHGAGSKSETPKSEINLGPNASYLK